MDSLGRFRRALSARKGQFVGKSPLLLSGNDRDRFKLLGQPQSYWSLLSLSSLLSLGAFDVEKSV